METIVTFTNRVVFAVLSFLGFIQLIAGIIILYRLFGENGPDASWLTDYGFKRITLCFLSEISGLLMLILCFHYSRTMGVFDIKK
jgi:hypothetical protein